MKGKRTDSRNGRDATRAAADRGFQIAKVMAEFETPLLRYVGRLLSPAREKAEDVVQEAFIRLHRQVEGHGRSSIRNLKTWLYRVVHNLAIDVVRKRDREGKFWDEVLAEGAKGGKRTVDRGDALGDLVHKEDCQEAMAELQGLPEEEKQVLLLRAIEGMKLREISEITGFSIRNVDYRINRALRELAERLKR